jgi:hypothetical protein
MKNSCAWAYPMSRVILLGQRLKTPPDLASNSVHISPVLEIATQDATAAH